MATMYLNGEGVDQDKPIAFQIFKTLAGKNFVRAQGQLGSMYLEGEGVEQDLQKAKFWFTKASQQNLASAQNNLGLMYLNGTGIPKDLKKAEELFKKASKKSDMAKLNLIRLKYVREQSNEQKHNSKDDTNSILKSIREENIKKLTNPIKIKAYKKIKNVDAITNDEKTQRFKEILTFAKKKDYENALDRAYQLQFILQKNKMMEDKDYSKLEKLIIKLEWVYRRVNLSTSTPEKAKSPVIPKTNPVNKEQANPDPHHQKK